jgi:DNA-binding NarL/FixJ family response regulator
MVQALPARGSARFDRGWFLVDIPHARLSEQVVRIMQRYGVVQVRVGELEASALMRPPVRAAGVVLASGTRELARLERVRALAPQTPMLALIEEPERDLLNALQRHGIEVAWLPLQPANVMSFAQRALCTSFLPHGGVARAVSHLAQTKKLTAREVQILSYSLGSEPRSRVRRRLGVAENTLKTQIRSLLRKCDERSVDALAKNLLRAALLGGAAQPEGASPSSGGREPPFSTPPSSARPCARRAWG